jgi:hypothetical protein
MMKYESESVDVGESKERDREGFSHTLAKTL